MAAFFRTAAEQDNKCLPVLAKVDPITGPEVDFALVDAAANAFDA